jgi:hypothetical protein
MRAHDILCGLGLLALSSLGKLLYISSCYLKEHV